MAVPWVQLIKYAPTILSLTKDLRSQAQRLGTQQQAGPERRLQELETDMRQLAEALHALARQTEGVTKALASLRRALLVALGLGGGALLLALAALVLALR